MSRFAEFPLPKWIDENQPGSDISLAGSLGPGLTLKELTSLSKDPQATAKALKFDEIKLAGGTGEQGGEELRQRIAELYDQSKVKITANDVVTAAGTSGANMLVLQSLLQPGDHVICMYPAYGPLLEIPKMLGATTSYWELDEHDNWQAKISALETLIKPNTKLLILNNPNNPTGTILTTTDQASIVEFASKHNLIVHSDEIFRPLFHHTVEETPTSILEHPQYDRTIATGSVSKAWCFSGVRIGWCVTRNAALRENMIKLREWTTQSTSTIDEKIAAEILGPRCKEAVQGRISAIARENLDALTQFAEENRDCVSCALPTGASIAFVLFQNPSSGKSVEDVEFCRRLKEEKGVLLSPGSKCFGDGRDFRGYTRVHLTVLPESFKKGLDGIGAFLRSEAFASLGGKANGNAVGLNGKVDA